MQKGFTLIEILVSMVIIITVGTVIAKSTNNSLNIIGALKPKLDNAFFLSFVPLNNFRSSKNKKIYLNKQSIFKNDNARLYLKNNSGIYSNKKTTLKLSKNQSKNRKNLPFTITTIKHTFTNKSNHKSSHIYTIEFDL